VKRNAAAAGPIVLVAIDIYNNFTVMNLPLRIAQDSEFYLFEQFQLELLPDWNAIIVRLAATSTRWVSQLSPQVSCCRKRLHAPEGREDA
jgi:hypothetical protein